MAKKGRFIIEPTPNSLILFNKPWYERNKKKTEKKGRFVITSEPVKLVSVKVNKPVKTVQKLGRFRVTSSSWKN